MWNFISSPEDDFLERDLGFNAQFFAFAVFIGPLLPKPHAWGSERSQDKAWGGAPQEREVIILWDDLQGVDPARDSEGMDFPSLKILISKSNSIIIIAGI